MSTTIDRSMVLTMTAPALNAVLKAGAYPGFCALIVVLTLENTATLMPIYPEAMLVMAPSSHI